MFKEALADPLIKKQRILHNYLITFFIDTSRYRQCQYSTRKVIKS